MMLTQSVGGGVPRLATELSLDARHAVNMPYPPTLFEMYVGSQANQILKDSKAFKTGKTKAHAAQLCGLLIIGWLANCRVGKVVMSTWRELEKRVHIFCLGEAQLNKPQWRQ